MKDILNVILEEVGNLFQSIYYMILGGKDHSLKASFERTRHLLSKQNTGFVLGDKKLSVDRSYKNLGVVSPTGGGKTSCHLFPSLLGLIDNNKKPVSMIVNDPSQELQKVIPYLISQDVDVRIFHPGKQEQSIYYNPLSRIQKLSDISKIAQRLTRISQAKDRDSFWATKSTDLISVFIQFLYELDKPQYLHLGQVLRLIEELQGSEDVISALFAKEASEDVYRRYKAIIGTSDDTKDSIISSAQGYLQFASDPIIANQLSADTLPIEQFRSTSTALFITCSPTEISYYKQIFSLWFEQYFNDVLQALPEDDDADVFLLLDELATSLHLPSLESVIAVNRKYRLPISYCIQSESQLTQKYGKEAASTILNNTNTLVYFGGLEVAEESGRLERTLGKYQYTKDDKTQTRPLMTADEIRCLKPFETIIVSTAMRPVKTILKPHFKQRILQEKMDTELSEDYTHTEPYHEAQYLDLNTYRESQNESA